MTDTLFFVASKLVWGVLRPDSWIVIGLALVCLGLWRGRARLAAWAGGVTFLWVLVLAILPLGDLAIRPLERAYPPDPSVATVTGIIVLGGGEEASASAAWERPQLGEGGDRFTAALALARRYPAARVVFTGGSGLLRDAAGDGLVGADVARAFFAAQGLSGDRVLYEDRSRNTVENARFTRAMLDPQPDEVWLLVTSAYHMPRAMESFRMAGWSGIVAYPVDFRSRGVARGIGWDLAENLRTLNVAVREWVGIAAYRLAGR